jgi:predicted permease
MDNSETKLNQTQEPKSNLRKQFTTAKALALAIQFAFIVIVPLLIFGTIGKFLENRTGNRLWLMGGLLLALTTTVIWFYRKISDLYKDFID